MPGETRRQPHSPPIPVGGPRLDTLGRVQGAAGPDAGASGTVAWSDGGRHHDNARPRWTQRGVHGMATGWGQRRAYSVDLCQSPRPTAQRIAQPTARRLVPSAWSGRRVSSDFARRVQEPLTPLLTADPRGPVRCLQRHAESHPSPCLVPVKGRTGTHRRGTTRARCPGGRPRGRPAVRERHTSGDHAQTSRSRLELPRS